MSEKEYRSAIIEQGLGSGLRLMLQRQIATVKDDLFSASWPVG